MKRPFYASLGLLPLVLLGACGTTSSEDASEAIQDGGAAGNPDSDGSLGEAGAVIAEAGVDGSPDASAGYFRSVDQSESQQLPFTLGDTTYTYRSALMHDVTGDGVPDVLVTIGTYPKNISHPLMIIDGKAPLANIAPSVFAPGGITSVRHSNQIFLADFDNDGLEDLLVSEAGLDHPPWTGDKIGIAINKGGGKYADISNTVPARAQGLRSYSLAAGRFFNDGVTRLVVPSQTQPDQSVLLSWQASAFVVQENWVDNALWWTPDNFSQTSFMEARDFDGDGYVDLYGSGSWTTPNHRILWGGKNFPAAADLTQLPEGKTGHTTWANYDKPGVQTAQGGDVNRVVFDDFNGDGKLDIVSFTEQVNVFKPGAFTDTSYPDYQTIKDSGGVAYYNGWLQVLEGDGSRTFTDITSRSGSGDLGMKYYVALFSKDLDLDGDLDLVGHYWSKYYNNQLSGPRWGTTVFLNDGNAGFRALDAANLFPELKAQSPDPAALGIGAMFPISITADSVEGIFLLPVDTNVPVPFLRVKRFKALGRFH